METLSKKICRALAEELCDQYGYELKGMKLVRGNEEVKECDVDSNYSSIGCDGFIRNADARHVSEPV